MWTKTWRPAAIKHEPLRNKLNIYLLFTIHSAIVIRWFSEQFFSLFCCYYVCVCIPEYTGQKSPRQKRRATREKKREQSYESKQTNSVERIGRSNLSANLILLCFQVTLFIRLLRCSSPSVCCCCHCRCCRCCCCWWTVCVFLQRCVTIKYFNRPIHVQTEHNTVCCVCVTFCSQFSGTNSIVWLFYRCLFFVLYFSIIR